MVPKAGLEPARPLERGILNPLRLPFRHLGPLISLDFIILCLLNTLCYADNSSTKRLPALAGDQKCQNITQRTLARNEPEATGK